MHAFGTTIRRKGLGALAWVGSVLILANLGSALALEPSDRSEVLAPGYGALNFEAPEPGTYRLPAIQPAADGTVLLPDGSRANLHALYDDHIVVLSFIYSTCNDVNGCPLATFVLHQIKRALDRSPELAESVRLLSLSFDPENDTPDIMRLYGANFARGHTDWQFLTTRSNEELAPILDAYGQSVQREYDAQGRYSGTISHVLRVFLIGRDKQIRNIYSVNFLHPDVLLADIRTLISQTPDAAEDRSPDNASLTAQPVDSLLERVNDPPLGLPKAPANARAPSSRAVVRLGQTLFFDTRLSANGTLACAHCHIPEQGFTNRAMQRAIGVEGRSLRRNTSSLYNVGYRHRLYPDGREFFLEAAVWDELLSYPKTGNLSAGMVLERLENAPEYTTAFGEAFPDQGITMKTVSEAIAAYMRTLVTGNSAFDRWHYGGDSQAMGAAARRGFQLFTGKAGCSSCHTINEEHALFTDQDLHNTGVGWYRSMHGSEVPDEIELSTGQTLRLNKASLKGTEERAFNDLGLYEATQKPEDRWRFLTPSLRNIALTSPYMHDGSLATLEDVVDYYNSGGHPHDLQDSRIRPLGLTEKEKDDLADFLRALTGGEDTGVLAAGRHSSTETSVTPAVE